MKNILSLHRNGLIFMLAAHTLALIYLSDLRTAFVMLLVDIVLYVFTGGFIREEDTN